MYSKLHFGKITFAALSVLQRAGGERREAPEKTLFYFIFFTKRFRETCHQGYWPKVLIQSKVDKIIENLINIYYVLTWQIQVGLDQDVIEEYVGMLNVYVLTYSFPPPLTV